MPTFRHDSGLPVSTGDPQKDIAGLRNAFYGLEEELRYMFNNLGEDNLGTGLSSFLSSQMGDIAKSVKFEVDIDGIVAEVRKQVGGDYGEILTRVELTAEGLRSTSERVSKLENTQGSVDESLKTEIIQNAKSVTLSAVAENYETKGNVKTAVEDLQSAINVEAGKIALCATKEDLSTNYYSKTVIDQTFENITLTVIDASGNETSLKLSDGKLDLKGMVTFTDLKNNSNTVINGNYIKTGTISAARLDLSNYYTASEVSAEISGSENGILSTVSQTYETISDANRIKNNLANNYYNKSTIDQKVGAIKLSVSTNGKEVSLTINGETQKIDLSGYVTFTNLSTNGQTTINGGNITTGTIAAARLDLSGVATISGLQNGTTTINGGCITTGTISADRVTGGTLQGTTIKGNTIIGGSFTTETALDDGNKFEVEIKNGRIVGLSYNPSTLLRGAKGFLLDSSGIGVMNNTGGLHSTVLSIDDSGDTHFDVSGDLLLNAKIVGRDADLDDVVANSVAANQINGKAFPGGYSLSEFANNAISMATAYTNSAGTTGGADVSMDNITEKDSAGVFSRSRYSNSYGYGILCSKAGYYLVSAHAVLSNKVATGQSNTIAIRKVVGGASTYIARNSLATSEGSVSGIVYTQDISPMLFNLEANSYLSMYVSNSNFATTNQGCYISAVYLGI